MTDLEARLSAALFAGASEAPSSTGLADGARRRLRRRRRTRSVVGGVLAVLLAAVPGGVLLARDGDRAVDRPGVVDPVDPVAQTSWRTETWGGLSVEVPSGWGYGAVCDGGSDPVVDVSDGERSGPECTGRLGVQFFGSALFDSSLAPGTVVSGEDGTWVGYTSTVADDGQPAVWVTAPDRGTAERILASARRTGTDPWQTVSWDGLALDVPADWAAGDTCRNTGEPVVTLGAGALCTGMAGYGVRLAPYPPAATLAVTDTMQRAEGSFWPEGSWWANVQVPGLSTVATLVTADRATGQRILDSARAVDASDLVWNTVTWQDLRVNVPPDWADGSRATWCLGDGPEEGHVQRPGTVTALIGCGRPSYGLGVTFGGKAAMRLVHPSGHVWQYDDGPMYLAGSWLGYWYDDQERLIQVNAGDRATVQRVLDSVRGPSDRQ